MIIYLALLLPIRSNGLPGGCNEADHFIPLYLAFLPVGFAMPLMSPCERWALTLSRSLLCCFSRKRPRHFTLILLRSKAKPYPVLKSRTVYFLLHFPSRYRDSALRSTASCGARTFLPKLSKGFYWCFLDNPRRSPRLLHSYSSSLVSK